MKNSISGERYERGKLNEVEERYDIRSEERGAK